MADGTEWDDFSQHLQHRNLALIVEDRKFWVSREGLADYSPVFSKMFYSDFRESTSDEVPLPGKSADEILELLRVLFPTKNTKKKVDYDNVAILSKLVDEYEIVYLKRRCLKFLDSMTEENDGVLNVFKEAIRCRQKHVVRAALPLFARFKLAELQPHLDGLPNEVHLAVMYQKQSQDGACHDVSGNYCRICSTRFCECHNNHVPRSLQRCIICRSCGNRTVFDYEEAEKCCRCIDPLAAAQLEKVDL